MMFSRSVLIGLGCLAGLAWGGEIDPMQKEWFPKYRKQANAPEPAEMLLNVDAEPSLEAGFNSLFNGKDFSDWEVRGGKQVFEIEGDEIVGTCVPREASGYLSTKKTDYLDFVFTCEMKWDVDLNSGVMFRGQCRKVTLRDIKRPAMRKRCSSRVRKKRAIR